GPISAEAREALAISLGDAAQREALRAVLNAARARPGRTGLAAIEAVHQRYLLGRIDVLAPTGDAEYDRLLPLLGSARLHLRRTSWPPAVHWTPQAAALGAALGRADDEGPIAELPELVAADETIEEVVTVRAEKRS
ncbi:MAG: hypothetical protein KC620_24780, partial [Myxococcales bacterium]|nr:hypothetical protein [Myxococcales bacterium]